MLNCHWAQALTRYDCRQVVALDGAAALEIGTPFSLHDGSPIVLYLVEHGSHLLLTDNGDTLAHLSGMGLSVWGSARLRAPRARASAWGLTLDKAGDFRCLSRPEHAAMVFARAVSGLLSVGDWAAEQLSSPHAERNLCDEAEPYIVARNPALALERRASATGASHARYVFDFCHGGDLIDVIAPSPQGTGGAMRKAGDVQNGPYAGGLSPLFIVDDRDEPDRANQEISIIGSVARAMPFTRLMQALH